MIERAALRHGLVIHVGKVVDGEHLGFVGEALDACAIAGARCRDGDRLAMLIAGRRGARLGIVQRDHLRVWPDAAGREAHHVRAEHEIEIDDPDGDALAGITECISIGGVHCIQDAKPQIIGGAKGVRVNSSRRHHRSGGDRLHGNRTRCPGPMPACAADQHEGRAATDQRGNAASQPEFHAPPVHLINPM